MPLQSIRENIDYHVAEAHTIYGAIGLKVWIYHAGSIFSKKQVN
jgi:small subunit ribosomal protein S3